MNTLDIFGGILYWCWAWYTIWLIYRMLRHIWPILKDDWFYLATKSGYYKGFGIGMAWCIIFNIPLALFGYKWVLVLIAVQFGSIYFFIRNEAKAKLEKHVWFGMPFFVCPLWMAIKQGINEGELPPLPDHALNPAAASAAQPPL